MATWSDGCDSSLKNASRTFPGVFTITATRLEQSLRWHEACARAGVPGLLFYDLHGSAVRTMQRAEPQIGHDGDQLPQEAVGCPINSPVRSNVETWIRR